MKFQIRFAANDAEAGTRSIEQNLVETDVHRIFQIAAVFTQIVDAAVAEFFGHVSNQLNPLFMDVIGVGVVFCDDIQTIEKLRTGSTADIQKHIILLEIQMPVQRS